MKSLFEYLISKDNKKRIKKSTWKDIFIQGDIVQDEYDNFYMYLDYETTTELHIEEKGKKVGLFVNSPVENTLSYMSLDLYDNNLNRIDEKNRIIRIWRGPKGYKFNEMDLNVENLKHFIETPKFKWNLIFER